MRVFGNAIVKLLHSEPPAHQFKIIEIGESFRFGDGLNCEMGEPMRVPMALSVTDAVKRFDPTEQRAQFPHVACTISSSAVVKAVDESATASSRHLSR